MRGSFGRDDKLHGAATFGTVPQFLTLIIRRIPGSSLARRRERAAIVK
ncbi:MAG TPA: hypothetical protein VNP98_17780 [Chthoniobacterales bacterium]|nr:hypothetical protein [Chthoniobacterales bacterium]